MTMQNSPSHPPLDDLQSRSRGQFDRQSARYGKSHILADTADIEAALQGVEWRSGLRALDVATGGGHTGFFLASRGVDVVFADISPAMLENIRQRARDEGLEVETREHPAEQLPYPDGSFDLVTCRVAAHHFSDVGAFVKESARVLREGGWFLLIDGVSPNNAPEATAWLHDVERFRDPSHGRLLSPNEWRNLVESAGLEISHSTVTRLKQPSLTWYFETAATSEENRLRVIELVKHAPESARRLFDLGEENGETVWWWQRMALLAQKSSSVANAGSGSGYPVL